MMKEAMEFLRKHFDGHEVELFDMDDAVYVEDHTTSKTYTYILVSGILIAHDA